VATEKGQALAKNPADSGQSRLLAINVPKRLLALGTRQKQNRLPNEIGEPG
jgi:hypothetical protein